MIKKVLISNGSCIYFTTLLFTNVNHNGFYYAFGSIAWTDAGSNPTRCHYLVRFLIDMDDSIKKLQNQTYNKKLFKKPASHIPFVNTFETFVLLDLFEVNLPNI